jgi:DNA mismatch repair protein MSH6
VRHATSLALDGQTLINLEIFTNTYDGSSKGTLFELLNHCKTAFGRRLFRKWMCHPLVSVDAINARLDAADDFNRIYTETSSFLKVLSKLPDLERFVSRINVVVTLILGHVH